MSLIAHFDLACYHTSTIDLKKRKIDENLCNWSYTNALHLPFITGDRDPMGPFLHETIVFWKGQSVSHHVGLLTLLTLLTACSIYRLAHTLDSFPCGIAEIHVSMFTLLTRYTGMIAIVVVSRNTLCDCWRSHVWSQKGFPVTDFHSPIVILLIGKLNYVTLIP